jgi:Excalibur calcium-binding domain
MKLAHRIGAVCVATMVVAGISMTPADAAASYTNCAALQKSYPHGVGKAHAHDQTTGTPVTNFTHSTKKYKKAMRANAGLDRDKDGVACEKA